MPWPRLSLFEFNDQPWQPALLRRAETDYLAAALDITRPFAPLAPRIAELCRRAGTDTIIDLCSGGGGPWRRLADDVAAAGVPALTVTLTDLHPDPAAYARVGGERVHGRAAPVDARAVPPELSGVRTMFDAFHHFPADDARAILANAESRRAPIVIAEVVQRRLAPLVAMCLLVPILVLVLTPRIRPRIWSRLVFTYLIPVIPVLVAWDGAVSCLRAYRTSELRALTAGLDGHDWEIGELRHRGAVVTYAIGAPRAAQNASSMSAFSSL
jgi:hypothetical protein